MWIAVGMDLTYQAKWTRGTCCVGVNAKMERCWQLQRLDAQRVRALSHSTQKSSLVRSGGHMHVYLYLLHVPIFVYQWILCIPSAKRSHDTCLRQLMFGWCTVLWLYSLLGVLISSPQQDGSFDWFPLIIYYLCAFWMDNFLSSVCEKGSVSDCVNITRKECGVFSRC